MNRIDGAGTLGTSRTLSGTGANGVDGAQGPNDGQQADRASSSADSLSVSDRGRVMAVASLAVRSAADVRADRVAALKAAIADGTYNADPREIAARLLAAGTLE
jgi:negative regulator of flagellin synthesis FlgM